MAKARPSRASREEAPRGTLTLEPPVVQQGQPFLVRGTGWDVFPILLELGKTRVRPQRILLGSPVEEGLRPAPSGEFLVELSTRDLAPGRIGLRVGPLCGAAMDGAEAMLDVVPWPGRTPARKGETEDRRRRRHVKEDGGGGPHMRLADWFKRRFGHLGLVPDGVRITQVESVRALRDRRNKVDGPSLGEPGTAVPGVCNWTPVGPGPVIVDAGRSFSGRVISIAFDPTDANTIYAGAANGGVWKTTDRGRTWAPKSDFQVSLAIGALAIDPNDRLRVFAGTGQYGGAVGTFYGNGILRSADGGNTWTELAAVTFQRDEISKILFDPTDATSQRMFLSARQGVWASLDGGVNWSVLRAGAASDLVLIVSGTNVQLIAGFDGSGIFTATRTAMAWSAWTPYASAGFPTGFGRIVLGQSRGNPNTIYAAFSAGGNIAGMARTVDGGTTWTRVTPPLEVDVAATSGSAGSPPHTHDVTLGNAAMIGGTLTYTTGGPTAGPAHTHSVTLTAAQLSSLRDGIATIALTSSTVSGHSHSFSLNRRRSNQTWYNFHITPHPTNPDIVYYGEVSLWKTSTGNGPWTALPILHTDNHAFAFAPDDANQLWSVGDGGVYVSPDAGGSFQHRNRDMQVLEYISVSQHPQWETVMIGGTQDNGTHRYTGSPAWEFVDGGDGGATAIDTTNPTRMYHEYIYHHFYRSDASGASGTWAYKPTGSPASSEFYSPFVLDPSNQNVCYFGGDELWRSADNSDTWAAVTATIAGNITAIAVHPVDATLVYAGTTDGRVYRVQRTGASWALADVTTTEITAAPLPAGVSISDLAVDAAGNLWVSVAAVLWAEATGEFSNDHVYLRAAGSSSWVSRSTGLAQANPVNTIAIDPSNANRLFCGCDVGVFRTDNAGVSWVPWDEGLPNVAVFDLKIHGPRRLLRAATHGRSIWERPIDLASCPMVDLYMRDNILDSGRVQPTPSAAHPFDATVWEGHWKSQDIKVDAPQPGFQTPGAIDNYVDFATLQHRTARRNRSNRFYVQVHNRGVSVAHSVRVRAFFAPTSPGLPPLPSDFWTGGRPFAGTPMGPDWTPVGATIDLGDLQPGEPGVAEWDWLIPSSAPRHSCLLAVATCNEDPIAGTGILNPDQLVTSSKHVTLKNLNVEDAVAGTAMAPDDSMTADIHAGSPEDRVAQLRVLWGALPPRTRIHVVFTTGPKNEPVVDASPRELKRLGIELMDQGGKLFPEATPDACGRPMPFDRKRVFVLSRNDSEATDLPAIRLSAGAPVRMGINLELPKKAKGTYEFDIVRFAGKRILGGVSYSIRTRDK
jgi:hypothetical protein